MTTSSMEAGAVSSFDTVPTLYTNWRGVTAIRHLTPASAIPFWWGESEHHKGPDGKPLPQWFFRAIDASRPDDGPRDYAVSGFKAFGQEALDAAIAAQTPIVEALRCTVAALDDAGIVELPRTDACTVLTDALRDVVEQADTTFAATLGATR